MSQGHGADRRKFGRKEANIAAQAIVPRRSGVPCTIRNISQMGALLEFAAPFQCRGNFRLIVDGNRLDAQCQIRRQDGNTVGIEFVAIAVHGLVPAAGEFSSQAPRFEGVQKPELVPSSGRALRERLYGKPAADTALAASVPAVEHAAPTKATAPEPTAV